METLGILCFRTLGSRILEDLGVRGGCMDFFSL